MTRQEIGAILMELREKAGKSREDVAEWLGKSAKTIGHWETGYAQPDANTLFSLCGLYGADLNAAFGFCAEKAAPLVSGEAMEVAKRYDALDNYGRGAVQAVMGEEERRMEEQAERAVEVFRPEPKVIPLYLYPAAAGYACPVFGEDYEPYFLGEDEPQGAEFAIRLQGDSMEPYFPDGGVVFCNRDPLQNGDVGIFAVDGATVCKQYYRDALGMVYLFSLNRARADADVLLSPGSGQSFVCQGRVITRKRFPLPR